MFIESFIPTGVIQGKYKYDLKETNQQKGDETRKKRNKT